jgi:hypothetical protein
MKKIAFILIFLFLILSMSEQFDHVLDSEGLDVETMNSYRSFLRNYRVENVLDTEGLYLDDLDTEDIDEYILSSVRHARK